MINSLSNSLQEYEIVGSIQDRRNEEFPKHSESYGNIINNFLKDMKQLENKTGVVIGVGNKQAQWADKGWETLDIDSTYNPTFVMSADNMVEIKDETKDVLLAEHLRISRFVDGKQLPGANPQQFIEEAHRILKTGGQLIIKTVDHNDGFTYDPNSQSTWYTTAIPKKKLFTEWLQKDDKFDVVILKGQFRQTNAIVGEGSNIPAQRKIFYIAEKK
ncbi:MAG: hypothetical protein ACI9S8_000037 [Chlamydiales bacterium]|jgi:hypothetical protein